MSNNWNDIAKNLTMNFVEGWNSEVERRAAAKRQALEEAKFKVARPGIEAGNVLAQTQAEVAQSTKDTRIQAERKAPQMEQAKLDEAALRVQRGSQELSQSKELHPFNLDVARGAAAKSAMEIAVTRGDVDGLVAAGMRPEDAVLAIKSYQAKVGQNIHTNKEVDARTAREWAQAALLRAQADKVGAETAAVKAAEALRNLPKDKKPPITVTEVAKDPTQLSSRITEYVSHYRETEGVPVNNPRLVKMEESLRKDGVKVLGMLRRTRTIDTMIDALQKATGLQAPETIAGGIPLVKYFFEEGMRNARSVTDKRALLSMMVSTLRQAEPNAVKDQRIQQAIGKVSVADSDVELEQAGADFVDVMRFNEPDVGAALQMAGILPADLWSSEAAAPKRPAPDVLKGIPQGGETKASKSERGSFTIFGGGSQRPR